jgi:hypothetical protein
MNENHEDLTYPILHSETDWTAVDNLADDQIDYSDIPPLTEEQLKQMRPLPEVLAKHGIKFAHKQGPYLVTVTHQDGSQERYLLAPQANDSPIASQTDWARLATMRDEEIDLSDIPEISPEQFAQAKPTKQFFAERGLNFDPSGSRTFIVEQENGTTTTYEVPTKNG